MTSGCCYPAVTYLMMPEGDFDADELAFDHVFRQELETPLASEEQLNDIPNIEMQETELSGKTMTITWKWRTRKTGTVQTMKTKTIK